MEITNKDICIVIPIYKDNINEPLLYDEVESIYHTIKVMHNYDIYFVCSQNLDISFYKNLMLLMLNINFLNLTHDYNIHKCVLIINFI